MLLQYIIKEDTPSKIQTAAETALKTGVTWIEICAPSSVDDDCLKDVIEHIRPQLADKGAVLIIADRYEQAKEWQCDGVHLYSPDKPVSAVRVAMDAWPIIGVNVSNLTDVQALRSLDIDYFFFESNGTPEDIDTVTRIARYLDDNTIETPLVIGGDITEANISTHIRAGAAAIATGNADNLDDMIRICRESTQQNI